MNPNLRRSNVERKRSCDEETAIKDMIDQYGVPALDVIPLGFKIGSILGKGGEGTTYSLCDTGSDPQECDDALKIQPWGIETKKELSIHHEFTLAGLALPVMSETSFMAKRCSDPSEKRLSAIHMKRLTGTLRDLLMRFRTNEEINYFLRWLLRIAIPKMRDYRISHGDLHDLNIGYRIEVVYDPAQSHPHLLAPVFYFLDFGDSVKLNTPLPNWLIVHDLVTLYRSLDPNIDDSKTMDYTQMVLYKQNIERIRPVLKNTIVESGMIERGGDFEALYQLLSYRYETQYLN